MADVVGSVSASQDVDPERHRRFHPSSTRCSQVSPAESPFDKLRVSGLAESPFDKLRVSGLAASPFDKLRVSGLAESPFDKLRVSGLGVSDWQLRSLTKQEEYVVELMNLDTKLSFSRDNQQ